MYYVDMKDGDAFGVLAGPYETQEEAEKAMPRIRAAAIELNARYHFWSFGTLKSSDPRVKQQAQENYSALSKANSFYL